MFSTELSNFQPGKTKLSSKFLASSNILCLACKFNAKNRTQFLILASLEFFRMLFQNLNCAEKLAIFSSSLSKIKPEKIQSSTNF